MIHCADASDLMRLVVLLEAHAAAGVAQREKQAMKKLLAIVMLIASMPAWGADEDRKYGTMGSESCDKYVKDRVAKGSNAAGYYAWVAGFVTAYNLQTPDTYSIVRGTNLEGMVLWLDNYCNANPLGNLASGMQALTAELYPNRYRTEKEAGH
ncbi:MAG: hypothetical protein ACREVC_15815 [Burkholderiales bacterium]